MKQPKNISSKRFNPWQTSFLGELLIGCFLVAFGVWQLCDPVLRPEKIRPPLALTLRQLDEKSSLWSDLPEIPAVPFEALQGDEQSIKAFAEKQAELSRLMQAYAVKDEALRKRHENELKEARSQERMRQGGEGLAILFAGLFLLRDGYKKSLCSGSSDDAPVPV